MDGEMRITIPEASRRGSHVRSPTSEEAIMRKLIFMAVCFCVVAIGIANCAVAQEKPDSKSTPQPAPQKDANAPSSYSGMYAFLKEGEFVQITVEDAGRVSGFISRYGDTDSDKDTFLDQYFKTGKLDGSQLNFTTQVVHGVSFDFKGIIERGEGKTPRDEAYFVLKGSLTKSSSDENKKVTSHSQDVALKMFPQEAETK
jgi:hypothetical protein